ncbi:hypothetical protein [Desulforhabdus amnigena]|uniref:Uncharacterized protein n=1 Tax=Desulforhabdus amnigena TaxID=40218 RepID=A0A9W6FT57_9BACT|nr:hypothetical protein [Desulforhabdus amnigena]GLI33035.1 hypothetical protein DAMNIGENAA_04680 [Desulforhabdus amnigena]
MCFRPATAIKKREIACPKCGKMNPLPLSMDSNLSELMGNEHSKAILEKHCQAMTADPRLKMAMGMTLKQIMPLSQGKLTQAMIDLVAADLTQLTDTKSCASCGETLPLSLQRSAGPAGPVKK